MPEQALFPEQARSGEQPSPDGQRTEADIASSERHSWSGYRQAPERLAAFCLSGQPVLDKLLALAGELLRRNGHDATLHGYAAADAARLGLQAAALWNVLLGLRLDGLPLPAPLGEAQRLRSPAQIVQGRSATLLDAALLCAALLERLGLHPLIVLEQEHAYAGLWLNGEGGFPRICTSDVLALRKRVQLKEVLLFDTGLLGQGVPFKEAIRVAQQHLNDSERFVLVLDVAQARAAQIRPLDAPAMPAADPRVLEAPELAVPAAADDALPAGPGGRLAQWQRRLLDLSLRNPLLNLRDSKLAIPLLAPDPAALEDLLADGRSFAVDALPRAATPEEAAGQAQAALAALAKGRLFAPVEADRLDATLVELYRKARTDLEEGGANTLFLAIGMLYWRRPGEAERSYRAPLILVPVSLIRKSINAGIRLCLGDDEPRFNTTLLEMLRQDFALDIQGFDALLPSDERGLDIAGILTRLRREVLELDGFEVVDEVLLSTFSFAKYLMWKDLVDRVEQLKDNPVVRHLLDTPREPFAQSGEFVEPRELDRRLSPEQLFTPLSADSSQLAAVVAAAEGRNFVMIGPPGTGKSQTIANMIAHNLALGRSVLFVAEKAAALEVVYRRLREHGLGEFCLELHSNKARKPDVIRQLGAAWQAGAELGPGEWERETTRLRLLRDELNQLVKALHETRRNGLSIRQALATAVAGARVPEVRLRWASADQHDAGAREQLLAVAERIDLNAAELGDLAGHPLAFVQQEEWSLAWQQDLLQQAETLAVRARTLRDALVELSQRLGLIRPLNGRGQLAALEQLLDLLPQTIGKELGFAFQADVLERLDALNRAVGLLERFAAAEGALSVPWPRERLLALDLAALQRRWQEAADCWWPLKILRLRQFHAWLHEQSGVGEGARIAADLPQLQELQAIHAELQPLLARLDGLPGWRGLDSDPQQLRALADTAWRLRQLLAALATDPEQLAALRSGLRLLVVDANELLAADAPVGRLCGRYLQLQGDFAEALEEFAGLAGRSVDQLYSPGLAGLESLLELAARLQAGHGRLHAWCAWLRVRGEALALGLLPLVEALEQGRVPAGQAQRALEVNYARWWLVQKIDATPALRNFVAVEHERKIASFRALDDRVREITAQCIRMRIRQGLVEREDAQKSSEFGIVRRELEKKTRHKPLRQLLAEAPNAIGALTPCLLMSPLSIAQYLPAGQAFDLVIFDEASQITVWDAIGAIARGRQTVVVGDPKQLPPTSFFSAAQAGEEEGSDDEDLESILDELLGANLPTVGLSWHYRSSHESLIAFSNHRYYKGGLITFPSPATEDRAVNLQYVAGTYDRGGNQTNRAEADAVVAEIEQRLQNVEPGALTLGVVTFNQKQQTLILDLLDAARRRNPALDRHFDEALIEPVFVKNLESVQGDERDLILFSTTFGPDSLGLVSMNFGPLNKSGGERRLNVAITRARSELKVFTSLRPEQIDLSRTAAEGVKDLRHFLEFAERGARALDEAVHGSVSGFDSPFEEAVARALAEKGWVLHPQVGVSRFRIDLGVVDPDAPGRYLAGIECDGATYHRSATARDRDKIRESVLRGLGWEILRLWSTDYWLDPQGTLDKLDQQLRRLLERQRARTGA
ncbi:DUF4011 domain-containing protein [Pseudomonas sp. MAP12]|uniref:DUF4011 domain-containing protein n=1 Tax=Geopseudomonas aromaticivorans TaxID=2849492 RepID=A0ABS6MS15_9GAMM|nr:DUF4011 domain-containing protein [Pseudomonas aromaticivorans]MBV2131589.1 DUF4011 domain-containing protein [Pseudomonas aromaticivorans]